MAAFVLLSSGCPSPASQGTLYMDTSKIPAELREDYASFATNCSKCHSLSRALNAPVRDPSHWDLYVARMMRTAGSAISPNEKPHILRFLHWYTLSRTDSVSSGEAYTPSADLLNEPEAAPVVEAIGPEPAPAPEPPPSDLAPSEGQPLEVQP
jgi:hypothetical protein